MNELEEKLMGAYNNGIACFQNISNNPDNKRTQMEKCINDTLSEAKIHITKLLTENESQLFSKIFEPHIDEIMNKCRVLPCVLSKP